MTSDNVPASTAEILAWLFQRSGYVRWQNPKRLRKDGPRYKKGDEVRLVAESSAELAMIRRLLCEAEFKPGNPFVKGSKYVQPLYGRPVVARFLAMVEAQHIELPEARKRRRKRARQRRSRAGRAA